MARVDVRAVLRSLARGAARRPTELRVGDSSFPVVWTPCAFGGRRPGGARPWVRCRCGRRVGVIYAFPDTAHFACRWCWGRIRYLSDALGPAARRRRRAWLLRLRLGGPVESFDDYQIQGFRPIPPRPAGMWRKVYERLADELRQLEGAGASPRSGRPRGMTERVYRRTLDAMARSPDGGAVEASVATLSRERLALRRRPAGQRPPVGPVGDPDGSL